MQKYAKNLDLTGVYPLEKILHTYVNVQIEIFNVVTHFLFFLNKSVRKNPFMEGDLKGLDNNTIRFKVTILFHPHTI